MGLSFLLSNHIEYKIVKITQGRLSKIEIFRPPLPRLSGFNNRIPMKITIDVRFSKTPLPQVSWMS